MSNGQIECSSEIDRFFGMDIVISREYENPVVVLRPSSLEVIPEGFSAQIAKIEDGSRLAELRATRAENNGGESETTGPIGARYTGEELLEFNRQRPFAKETRSELLRRGYLEAVRTKNASKKLSLTQWYVDEWLNFGPKIPGLHNFFQAGYWFNRLTIELVREKRIDEAKAYLERYFDLGWEKYEHREYLNMSLRKRLERICNKK